MINRKSETCVLRITTLIWLLASVGCGQSLAFRIIDAETRKPLPGVLGISDTQNMSYISYVDEIRRCGGTDDDGKIEIEVKTYFNWVTNIEFFRVGYYDSGYEISHDHSVAVRRLSGKGNTNIISQIVKRDHDGAIIIEMYKAAPEEHDLDLGPNWVNRPTPAREN